MKKHKHIVLLGIVFVVLIVAYTGITKYQSYTSEKKATKKAAKEKADQIAVTDIKNIVSISYNYNGEMSFIKENETWYDANDKSFPLEQSYLTAMENEVKNIIAIRELTDGDQLSDYGLDNPSYTISLKDSDGKETIVYVGNAAGDNYYLTTGNKDNIYTVPNTVVSDISYNLNDMIAMDTFPSISSGNLKKVTITQNGSPTTYTSDNEEEIASVAGGLGAFAFSSCADYSVTDSELASYGLDEASRITVDAVYEDSNKKEQTLTMYVGAIDSTGANYYVQLKGSAMVNLATVEIVNNVLKK